MIIKRNYTIYPFILILKKVALLQSNVINYIVGMGISQIRKYCFEGEEEAERPNHYRVLAADFSSFEKDRWYTFQNPILFDPNKFIFLYPNYESEQRALLNRWKATIDIKTIEYGESRNEEDVVSTRWKYAIKRGVPIEYYKIIISVIFNKNFNNLKPLYDKLKNQINFNEPVPLFSLDEASIRQAAIGPFLNERGIAVLKQLMYLFKKKKGEMFYNRYIGHLASILMIFFEDYQAYELISTMMDESSNMSLNRMESFRWHMVFKEDQMKNLAQSFYNIVSKNSESVAKLEKIFIKNGIDKVKLFCRIVENFFYGYLPFPLILRVFILFLNEGVKMFFRVFYAMIIYAEQDLFEATSLEKALLIIKRRCLMITTSESVSILKKSFNLNLKATISTNLIQSRLKKEQSQRKYYFLPFIKGASNILSFDDLEIIWGFLPFQLKSYDLELKYPLEESQGPKHLKDLLKSLQKSRFNLIIIRSVSYYVFGCFFIDSLLPEESPTWYGSNQNFLFTLSPKQKKFSSQRENNQYLLTTKDEFKVGAGGNGSALVLKENLKEGQTYKCNTFRNDPLNNQIEGHFEIQQIEAFTLY